MNEKEIKRILSDITKGIKKYDDFFSIDSKKILVSCDTHSYLLHEEFVYNLIDISKAWGIKDFVHAGDLFEQECFSPFGRLPDAIPFENEIERLEKLMKLLTNTYQRIWLLLGNHDCRVIRLLTNEFSNTLLCKLLTNDKRVRVSNYPSLDINSTYKVVHPGAYSVISGNVAKALCSKFLRSVVCAHGHFTSYGYDVSGKFRAIDIGGNIDRNKTAYIHKRITKHPRWVKSFLIIADNNPYLVDENSDVGFWKYAGGYFNRRGKR